MPKKKAKKTWHMSCNGVIMNAYRIGKAMLESSELLKGPL